MRCGANKYNVALAIIDGHIIAFLRTEEHL